MQMVRGLSLRSLQEFHGEKELFKSNHADLIDAETVLQKCDVHSITKYRVSF